MLLGGGFYAYGRNIDPEGIGNVLAHRRDMGRQFGGLAKQRGVDVAQLVAVAGQNGGNLAGQRQRVSALVGGVGIGKMFADIAQGSRAQHGIHNGVQQNIGIGMPQQPFFVRNFHTAQD